MMGNSTGNTIVDGIMIFSPFIGILMILGVIAVIVALIPSGFPDSDSNEEYKQEILDEKVELLPWNCKNCGGPNSRNVEMCEYCGEAYEK